MTSSYRKTVEALAEQVGPARMPCARCQDSTLASTLAQYGARCLQCFEAFCAEGISGGRDGFVTGKRDTIQQAEMRKRARKLLDMARDGQKVGAEEIRGALRVTGDLVGAA